MFLGHLTASLGTDINPNNTHGVAQAGASDDPLPRAPQFIHPTGSGAASGSQNKNPNGEHLSDRHSCFHHLHAVGTVTGVEAMVLTLLAIPPIGSKFLPCYPLPCQLDPKLGTTKVISNQDNQ